MRAVLAEAGYDDIPANGLHFIGGHALARDVPLRELVEMLDNNKRLLP